MTINVIDAPMGTGKTSSAINFINAHPENRYLYITPYLDEVKRVKEKCDNFREPPLYGTKMNGIKYLFDKESNIVSTHSLFNRFNEEILDLTRLYGYVLIMDEVAEVVKPLEISKKDKELLLDRYTRIDDETHLLVWTDREYTGKLEEYKNLCDMGCITIYGNKEDKFLLMWMFPVTVFRAFQEVYILTYFFHAQEQKYYYDLYNCEYNYMFVTKDDNGEYVLTNENVTYDMSDIKKNITVINDTNNTSRINKIGNDYYALSNTWYYRYRNTGIMKILKNNCENFFRHITKTPSSLNLWTTFKDYEDIIKGNGYAKSFVPINLRATNKYRDRVAVAYMVNIFMNPIVKNFFLSNGVEIEEDEYALSEMLQLIFRSAIREGNPIKVYIPSKRMRELLEDWLVI